MKSLIYGFPFQWLSVPLKSFSKIDEKGKDFSHFQ